MVPRDTVAAPNASPIEFELGTSLIGGRQPWHTAQFSLGPPNPPAGPPQARNKMDTAHIFQALQVPACSSARAEPVIRTTNRRENRECHPEGAGTDAQRWSATEGSTSDVTQRTSKNLGGNRFVRVLPSLYFLTRWQILRSVRLPSNELPSVSANGGREASLLHTNPAGLPGGSFGFSLQPDEIQPNSRSRGEVAI